jgi:hypothetical protein
MKASVAQLFADAARFIDETNTTLTFNNKGSQTKLRVVLSVDHSSLILSVSRVLRRCMVTANVTLTPQYDGKLRLSFRVGNEHSAEEFDSTIPALAVALDMLEEAINSTRIED